MNKPIADIHLIWEVTRACNFQCSYCLSGSNRVREAPQLVNVAAVMATLDASEHVFEINLVGGEPSILPNFIELVKHLTKRNYVFLSTNLAAGKVYERFVEEVTSSRITGIDGSFHVEQREKRSSFEKYAQTWNLLNDHGFKLSANYVAHPSLLGRIFDDLKRLNDLGVVINPTPYIGMWEGRAYPESYTPEEQELLFRKEAYKGKWDAFIDEAPTRIYCNAGYNVFWVGMDGTISKCTTYLKKNYGNIYSGFDGPDDRIRVCTATTCSCPYYSVLEHYFRYGMSLQSGNEQQAEFICSGN